MYKFYNPNPCGRRVGDCSVRALTIALDTDWHSAYDYMCRKGAEVCDMPSSNAVWGDVLREQGMIRHVVSNACPECYSIGDFAADNPHGLYVVGTGNHVVSIYDGTIYDSWDSRFEIPQYYFRRT